MSQVKVKVIPNTKQSSNKKDVSKVDLESEDLKCKGPNMGAGEKYDFTKEGNRYKAGPASYSIPSVFDMKKFKKQGASFRVSRNQARQHSYLNPTSNPGPGKYKPEAAALTSDVTNAPNFSMALKTQTQTNFITPAPSKYDQSINWNNSKYQFKGNTVIQPITSLLVPQDFSKLLIISYDQSGVLRKQHHL